MEIVKRKLAPCVVLKFFVLLAVFAVSVLFSSAFAQMDESKQEPLSELQRSNLMFSYDYPASRSESMDQLASIAEEQGKVRVIIILDVPIRLEGTLTESQKQNQQEMIARAQGTVLQELASVGAVDESTYSFKHVPYIASTIDKGGLNALADSATVANIVRDVAEPPLLFQSTDLIEADKVWDPSETGGKFTGKGWQVAVLDSGVDKNHDFLSGKVVSEACYSSTVPADDSQSLCPGGVLESTSTDSGLPCTGIAGCDHGTHVAGIAAGDTFLYAGNTHRGVAPDAEIIAIKVFSQFNDPSNCFFGAPCILSYTSDQMKGLERVIDLAQDPSLNIASVNLSLGGGRFTAPCDSDVRKPLIDQLKSFRVATVIASGNNGHTDAISTPSCISSAVSVGSTTKSDNVSSFSNSAPMLDLLAPGSSITSSLPGNGFGVKSGTSMATPHVAGAWALLKEKVESNQSSLLLVDNALATLKSDGVDIVDSRNGLSFDRIKLDDTIITIPEFPLVLVILASAVVMTIVLSRGRWFALRQLLRT